MKIGGSRWRVAAAVAIGCAISISAGVSLGATGNLSAGACLSGDTATGNAGTSACSQSPLPTAGGTDSGIDGIQSVDVSANGKSIYATSQGDDAIVHLERTAATGAIAFSDCISGETTSGPVGGAGRMPAMPRQRPRHWPPTPASTVLMTPWSAPAVPRFMRSPRTTMPSSISIATPAPAR